MPVASDIILNWMHEDGYSLSETGWVRPQVRKFYFEVTAEKDGHRHIAPHHVTYGHQTNYVGLQEDD